MSFVDMKKLDWFACTLRSPVDLKNVGRSCDGDSLLIARMLRHRAQTCLGTKCVSQKMRSVHNDKRGCRVVRNAVQDVEYYGKDENFSVHGGGMGG